MRKTEVGGQAVIEGVMMRGLKGTATAVRTPEGKIQVNFEKRVPASKKNKFLSLPVIRGFVALIDSLVMGMQSLNFSASFLEEEGEPSKFEKWLDEKFKEKGEKIILTFSLIISLAFAVALFFLLPTALTSLFRRFGLGVLWLNCIEAAIRISIFLLYIYFIGKMEDISRVFEYHGAEHKTIFCYENEEELTVENVKKYSRLHPRCGTNFLFLVMVVSIIIFSFTGWKSMGERFLWRILLLPIVSGITFEIIKWMGKGKNKMAEVFAAPGLKLQLLTTREPDDSEIEVAIAALKAAEGIKETIGELLDKGVKELKVADIDSYLLDAQLLLGKVLKKDKIYIITHREEEVSKASTEEYLEYIEMRKNKMPIKYILKQCEFMGIDLYIKEGVLIPRPDTEILVEKVLEHIKPEGSALICDLCCGSGAIGISLAKFRPGVKVQCIDISERAEEVTKINIQKLDLGDRVTFIKSDLLEEALIENKTYDIIVSNPPYIKEEDINTLMEDVKNYEPHLALNGGKDGLDFYRKITEQSSTLLKNGGMLAYETGYNQREEVIEILEHYGFKEIISGSDLGGNHRVVIGFKRSDID
ncbi:peptide chain release factor N(5)-glutamine methyltransferase [Clostridium polynesiense]|uniref:peptide chain release factor N(5)-glutamine methyltransferase n=1 Tax=Clostridium polynesiense TaxID=1325933 RepID=UPI00058C09D5|nr:peptide chain release factor N(5)-glutamine methyltransferase [Clostridium polynesiense]